MLRVTDHNSQGREIDKLAEIIVASVKKLAFVGEKQS